MSFFYFFVVFVQIISAFSIILLVLLQNGKGSEISSLGGSGSSLGVFGSSGSANFLSKSTKWFAIVFFVSTISISYLNIKDINKNTDSSIMYSEGRNTDVYIPDVSALSTPIDKNSVEKKPDSN